ncbi:uncharacterized protein LOC119586079 [Penaeus monodon]|uniref:uncharacterized protein LOC119586079 n=1 Tax=Penaeus monodon TaxID=6687 RepID=UPI0018A7737A|nr:uncharacterized protein LOC119586079 [Penaeus monodon]
MRAVQHELASCNNLFPPRSPPLPRPLPQWRGGARCSIILARKDGQSLGARSWRRSAGSAADEESFRRTHSKFKERKDYPYLAVARSHGTQCTEWSCNYNQWHPPRQRKHEEKKNPKNFACHAQVQEGMAGNAAQGGSVAPPAVADHALVDGHPGLPHAAVCRHRRR